MVSNQKIKRYETNILGNLNHAIEEFEKSGKVEYIINVLGGSITAQTLLDSSKYDQTGLYKTVQGIDDVKGTLSQKFIEEVPQLVIKVIKSYKLDHRIEPVVLIPNLLIGNSEIETVYSTHSSRELTKILEMELNGSKIRFSNWYSEFFSIVANKYGKFYGVEEDTLIKFAMSKGIDTRTAKRKILYETTFKTMEKEIFDETQIVSPTPINHLIYTRS